MKKSGNKRPVFNKDSRYLALKHLRDSTNGHRCPICVAPLEDKYLESHHVFHDETSRRWLVQDVVWLCGTHHNAYTHGAAPPEFLPLFFGEIEQRTSTLPHDFRPNHLVGLWSRHMDASRFGTAYQIMRLSEYIVREFSTDFNQSVGCAIKSLASLRPKLSDLSDVLFEDTIRRSVLPFVLFSNVSEATCVEVCMQVAFSLFDRGEFDGFDQWARLAASFCIELPEQTKLDLEMQRTFENVRHLSSKDELRKHLDAISALEERAVNRFGTSYLVSKQHRAIGSLKVGDAETAQEVVADSTKTLDCSNRKIVTLNRHEIEALPIPGNGVWLSLGYCSIETEALWLHKDKEWLAMAFHILNVAESYGVTNFWVEPPGWLDEIEKQYKQALIRSGLFYPPRPPQRSLQLLLNDLRKRIEIRLKAHVLGPRQSSPSRERSNNVLL